MDDATRIVRMVHTAIARCAVEMLAMDTRITPASAMTALVKHGAARLAKEQPEIVADYRRALGVLGIRLGHGEMTYDRFLSYVDVRVRLQLTPDRKVAGR